ncbi:hypothetical protein [Leptospira ryugenii]|uniref:hypothetical protein n=1 Tax=Leptospira ryugenii TaxID=1917863 RepID=UPI00107FB696|nr:hypothetical protein [Leptospira ryugenii]
MRIAYAPTDFPSAVENVYGRDLARAKHGTSIGTTKLFLQGVDDISKLKPQKINQTDATQILTQVDSSIDINSPIAATIASAELACKGKASGKLKNISFQNSKEEADLIFYPPSNTWNLVLYESLNVYCDPLKSQLRKQANFGEYVIVGIIRTSFSFTADSQTTTGASIGAGCSIQTMSDSQANVNLEINGITSSKTTLLASGWNLVYWKEREVFCANAIVTLRELCKEKSPHIEQPVCKAKWWRS